MSNQIQNQNNKKRYDLKDRTAKFGEEITINFEFYLYLWVL